MAELIIRLVDGRHASSIMDVEVVDCDSDHQLDRIDIDRKYQNTKVCMVQGKGSMTLENLRIWNFDDIRRTDKERGYWKQENNQNEEISATNWEIIKKFVTSVAVEVVGWEERKKRNDWYNEECQRKVEERKETWFKMLNMWMSLNTDNYKNRWRKAKKMCRAPPQKKIPWP